MIVIPAMDLIDQQVVRLNQGDYNQKTVYNNDIIAQAKTFTQAGYSRLHIVDLSGAKSAKLEHNHVLKKIKQLTQCVIEYGGGIRDFATVEKLFQESLSKEEDFVMIGSLPFKNRVEFDKICLDYLDNIIMTVDVWGHEIRISGWQENTSVNIFEFIEEMKKHGLRRFLVTQIKKDGMLSGPDFELYHELLRNFDDIDLIASGGVSSKEDLSRLAQIPKLFGAILGKAYYENRVALQDIKMQM